MSRDRIDKQREVDSLAGSVLNNLMIAAALLHPDVSTKVVDRFRNSGAEIKIQNTLEHSENCSAALIFGGDGNDVFSFTAGQAAGDTILDFQGNGSSLGDSLSFQGYGTAAGGASFQQLDATHWQINSADGTIHETIIIATGTTFDPSDYLFS